MLLQFVFARCLSTSFCLSFWVANQHKFSKIVTRFELTTLAPAIHLAGSTHCNTEVSNCRILNAKTKNAKRRSNEAEDKGETDTLHYNISKHHNQKVHCTSNSIGSVCARYTCSLCRRNDSINVRIKEYGEHSHTNK